VRTRAPELARIADLIDERGWRPVIDSVHTFDGFQAAYDRVEGAAAG
jgi:endonuclease IV